MFTKTNAAVTILLSLSAIATIAEAHLNLVPVAVAPSLNFGSLPCGYMSGDGCVYGTTRYGDTLLALVFRGNSWQTLRQLEPRPLPAAIGDGDRDGKPDLVSANRVFEALHPDTTPSESVWGTSSAGGPFAQFTDFDQDSLPEITFESNGGWGVQIFENRGNNEYVQVCSMAFGAAGTPAVGDFGADGLIELASGSPRGRLSLIECTGNDQYAMICTTTVGPEDQNYFFAAANDMDHNGLPEFVSESRLDSNPDVCILSVFEEPTHGEIERVWMTALPTGLFAECVVVTGDVDGDLVDEFAVNTGYNVRVFKCTGLHQYEEQWQCPSGVQWIQLFDLNQDHRDELILSYLDDSTRIYEDTSGLVALQFERLSKPQVVNIPATIVRAGSSVSFPSLDRNTEVAIYDVRGRITTKHTAKSAEAWRWDLTDQQGRRVPAGTYFAVIRSGTTLTKSKLCVIN
jgi:hypothetical protein